MSHMWIAIITYLDGGRFFLEFSEFYYTSTSVIFLLSFFSEKRRSNTYGIYDSTPQTVIDKDPQNSNSEQNSENREILSVSKFDPATGVMIFLFESRHTASAPSTSGTQTGGVQ